MKAGRALAAVALAAGALSAVIGGLDAPHMIQAGEESAKRIPGAQKVVYAGSGHMVNMQEPEKFNRDLEAFLTAHPSR